MGGEERRWAEEEEGERGEGEKLMSSKKRWDERR